jgi:hypothetical protein
MSFSAFSLFHQKLIFQYCKRQRFRTVIVSAFGFLAFQLEKATKN